MKLFRAFQLNSIPLSFRVVASSMLVFACGGWIWGYYENIVEKEAWENNLDNWCGTVIFFTPLDGVIVGIVLGMFLGLISTFFISLFNKRKSMIHSILKYLAYEFPRR